MKTIIAILIAGLLLGGCATPERLLTTTTWDGPTTATQTVSRETGIQFLLGERHDAQAAPGGVLNASEISKAQMGAVATAAIWAVAGAYLGGAPGMILGGAGGAAAASLGGDKATTSTITSLAPLLMGHSSGSDINSQLGNALAGGSVTPEAGEALKALILANPEQCRLCKLIGQDRVFALIDQLEGKR